MDKDNIKRCSNCRHWRMGIPIGRCYHNKAGLLFTSNQMVFEDASEDCPIIKKE